MAHQEHDQQQGQLDAASRDPRGEVFESHRPWGRFRQFTHNEHTTVKIISVSPGHRLSLQTHEDRGELWVILDGPLDVTIGEQTWSAVDGDEIWIPRGTVHRVGNSSDRGGRLLEIALGHFDEDDIVRLEDDYSR